jgi:hypothetical protein
MFTIDANDAANLPFGYLTKTYATALQASLKPLTQ